MTQKSNNIKFIPQKYINPFRKGNNKENKLLLIHNKAAKLENKKIKNYGGKSYESRRKERTNREIC